MRLKRALPFLPLLLVAASYAEAGEPQGRKCTPSFVEVSPEEPIRAEPGSWRILFKVALVGCAEKLKTLTNEELDLLREEFRNPTEWSNLWLANKQATKELRRRATKRVTDVLSRRTVTDILFHDVTILDHNIQ